MSCCSIVRYSISGDSPMDILGKGGMCVDVMAPLGEALDIVDELHLLMTFYNCTRLSLSELLITETELKLIAAAAIMGDNSIPKNGYKTPAAIGTPAVL